MQRTFFIVVSLVMIFSTAKSQGPNYAVDQSQEQSDYGFWFESQVERWQEFRPTATNLGRIDLLVRRVGNPGDIIITIKDSLSNQLGVVVVNQDSVPPGTNWVEASVTPRLALSPEHPYRIFVKASKARPDLDSSYYLEGQRNSSYDRGIADPEDGLPGYDHAFRTYAQVLIDLSVPTMDQVVGDTILVPVNIVLPQAKTYSSAELSFGGYQNNGLTFLELDTASTLAGAQGWQVQVNNTDTLLITASASAEDISGSGVLFYLKFYVTGSPCTFVPLTINKAVFNTGTDTVVTTSGGVNIKALPSYGDVDGNGLLQAYDAALVLKQVAFVDTLGCQALANSNVSCDTTVSAYDATLILKRVVGLTDTLPFCGAVQASGSIKIGDITTPPPDTVGIALNLSSGDNILSFEGLFAYNPEQLSFANVIWSPLLDGFIKEVHAGNGEIHFAGAGSVTDGHEGVFATLQFVILHKGQTTVALKGLRWNEGPIVHDIDSAIIDLMGVKEIGTQTPTDFALGQNYPNPFNPVTSFTYDLPSESRMRLSVYNTLGQEIAILSEGTKQAGKYNTTWNPVNLTSGLYFYKLQATSVSAPTKTFTRAKKMILLR